MPAGGTHLNVKSALKCDGLGSAACSPRAEHSCGEVRISARSMRMKRQIPNYYGKDIILALTGTRPHAEPERAIPRALRRIRTITSKDLELGAFTVSQEGDIHVFCFGVRARSVFVPGACLRCSGDSRPELERAAPMLHSKHGGAWRNSWRC